MRRAAALIPMALACAGLPLSRDVALRGATREEAERAGLRVPEGTARIDADHHELPDVQSTRVCFDADADRIALQRAEARSKGAVSAPSPAPPDWPDFASFGWTAPGWWPTSAPEIWRWDAPEGSGLARGALWTIDGHRCCVWVWSYEGWCPAPP